MSFVEAQNVNPSFSANHIGLFRFRIHQRPDCDERTKPANEKRCLLNQRRKSEGSLSMNSRRTTSPSLSVTYRRPNSSTQSSRVPWLTTPLKIREVVSPFSTETIGWLFAWSFQSPDVEYRLCAMSA